MKLTKNDLMTVGELRQLLEDIPDDTRIYFGCFSLGFHRLKWRGEGLLQMEFNQTVWEDENGSVSVDNHQL